MDTRSGDIYDNRELAEAAGVPDEDLVTGSREALEKLRKKLVFTEGSFKSLCPTCGQPMRGSFPTCAMCQQVSALKGESGEP